MTVLDAYPTLRNAPITEAVIDFRVSTSKPFTAELLATMRDRLAAAFPVVEEQRSVEQVVEVVNGRVRQPVADQGVRRIVLRSEERQEAVLVSDSGFGFSKLRPYTNWEDVFSSAQRWWAHYLAAADVESVNRVAVRYINRFSVAGGQVEAYLEAPPRLPKDVPSDGLANVFSRLLFRDGETETETAVVQFIEWSGPDASVLMDIDASRSGRFSPDDEGFWGLFRELRAAKNRIFFGSITTHAREEFDQ